MKKKAIIVAAGNGSRMNSEIPKQFMLLQGKPLLYYTIKTFLESYPDLEIILVLPEDHIAKGKEIIDGFFDEGRVSICSGGANRFESVKNGVGKLGEEECIVFVHDGVRCLITKDLIHLCYESALENHIAIPVINSKDSVRIEEEGGSVGVDRHYVKLVQTPQTFHSEILVNAFNIDYKPHFTDEATVVEAFGLKINLVEGEENNFKITTPLDMLIAEQLIAKS